ncbi:uncharacterized protein BO97DRAFT_470120 [Aspergillus homomorphus CBS 101889]|uniref:MFS general substrate transporter n=1 Tax=Aspergillus homomorphus (strain CBS 101889) TaxID=1450537 RepID=A0A395HXS0_ASPHC|nr:hypothetical protein BO97DRAFT_470120 [Aspergillus homomorphus CBS 101889]RAL12580.1 hypothetical protein BO97DRAFT_470120 [Aspergillus homomorphus CBS 101889]
MRICAFVILALLIVANLTMRTATLPPLQRLTRQQLVKPLGELQFVLLALGGSCFFTFGFFIPVNQLPSQALDAGMPATISDYLVPILNAGSLVGRLTSALWLPAASSAALIAFAVLFGFFSGAYVSLLSPLALRVSPQHELGFRSGIIMFISAIAGLLTNPINGAILDSSPAEWVGLKIFSDIFTLAGTTCVLVARVRLTRCKVLKVC